MLWIYREEYKKHKPLLDHVKYVVNELSNSFLFNALCLEMDIIQVLIFQK